MPDTLDDFYADRHSIIEDLFIRTADDNYVLARWCFHQSMNVDFFWLAVHALEKYLKAILLLNGMSSKGIGSKQYQHNIVDLYAAVAPLAPELLPADLNKPDDRMPDEYWRVETMVDFLARLYRDGQAHNRYQLFGYSRQAEDLWKLDRAVYSVRRMCRPLEAYVLGRPVADAVNISNRESLARDPDQWRLNSLLESTMEGKRGNELMRAALTWNFPFAPPNFNHPQISYEWSSRDSVFIRRLYDPLEAGPEHFSQSDVLWQWVQDNIQIPKQLTTEIESQRKKIKAKSKTSTSS
ncbi:hypothetical protein ACVWZ4_002491 [Bradyrhizobium sp. USDA 4472]